MLPKLFLYNNSVQELIEERNSIYYYKNVINSGFSANFKLDNDSLIGIFVYFLNNF